MKVAFGLALLASSVSAQIARYCTSQSTTSGPCYSVFIPSTTSNSGSGDIFLQITAPTSYAWVAGGIGSQMAGSNVFVVYTDSTGNNLTLSPRQPTGHVMPQFAQSVQAVLIAGSGIKDGMMTANIKCSNCQTWPRGSLDVKSSSSSWVWAAKQGSALKSSSQTQTITQHDDSAVFTLDLTAATGADTANPFVAANSPSGTASGTSPSATVQSVSGGSSGSSGSTKQSSQAMILLAHGVLMGLVFLGIYPFTALMMRVLAFNHIAWVHGSFQIFGMILMYVAMSLGIYYAHDKGLLFTNTHTILGLVVVCLMTLQPFFGFLHHRNYRKVGQRSVLSYVHMFYGRILIILGGVNGILGPKLVGKDGGTNTFAIVFAVVMLLYAVVWAATAFARRRKAKNEAKSRTRKISPPMAMP